MNKIKRSVAYIKQQRSVLYFPMKLVQIYLGFIIVLYIFGPFKWPTRNAFLLYLFLFLAQILLFSGYRSSLNKRNRPIKAPSTNYDKILLKYLKVAISINLLFIILNTIRNTGLSFFSVSTLFEKVIRGLMNPGQQYRERFFLNGYGGPFLTYITVILSPFLWMVLPLSLYYFKNINLFNKILTLVAFLFEAARWISIGTNKGIVDLIIIVCSILLIKILQDKYLDAHIVKLKPKNRFIVYVLLFGLIMAGISFFSNTINSRVGGVWGSESLAVSAAPLNTDALLVRILPDFVKPTMIYVTSYLTQGYYGLSLALTEPFIPMFGIGNSMFLMDNCRSIFGVDFYRYTYQTRLAYLGWDPLVNWHSIYVWLANDVSFFGILPLLYLLGRFFGSICKDAVVNRNPIACVIFCLLLIMFFYFPLNNQILSYPTTFMAFWGLTLYWLFKRFIAF